MKTNNFYVKTKTGEKLLFFVNVLTKKPIFQKTQKYEIIIIKIDFYLEYFINSL